jgi:hypothetical protein
MTQILKALQMFNELVQKGYIVPTGEHSNLKPLSIYRSVPSVMTSGTGPTSFDAGQGDAKLDSPSERNSGHKG